MKKHSLWLPSITVNRYSLWLTLKLLICVGLNWWMWPAPRVCVSPIAIWKLPAT